jgi:hypothetical protein
MGNLEFARSRFVARQIAWQKWSNCRHWVSVHKQSHISVSFLPQNSYSEKSVQVQMFSCLQDRKTAGTTLWYVINRLSCILWLTRFLGYVIQLFNDTVLIVDAVQNRMSHNILYYGMILTLIGWLLNHWKIELFSSLVPVYSPEWDDTFPFIQQGVGENRKVL